MKKKKGIIIGFICALSLQLSCFAAQDKITVKVNGKTIDFKVNPIVENDRTLVSLREIFESLGANVKWVEETKEVIATKDNTTIKLQIDNKNAVVNNKNVALDVPAKIVNSKTVVPVRFISESLGAKVDWNNDTNTISITQNNSNNIQITYNNTKDYSILYSALKNIDSEKFQGIATTNISAITEDDEDISSYIGINTVKVDESQNFEMNTSGNGNRTSKKNKLDKEDKKINLTTILLGDKIYNLQENNKWTEDKIEKVDEFKEDSLNDDEIKNILEVFDKIKISKISDKEYELDLNSSDSNMFKASLIRKFKEKVESVNINSYILKVSLNEKNEIIKISDKSNFEYSAENIKSNFKRSSETTYDRKKVEIKAPNDVISNDLITSLLEKGYKLNEEGKCQEAITYFDKVISIDSKNCMAYNNKAWALIDLGKYEEALNCADKAVELNEYSPYPYVNKGDALLKLDRKLDALECYNEAIKLDEECSEAYYGKGMIALSMKSYSEAFKAFEKYVNLVKDDSDAYVFMGECLGAQEKYNEAIKYYDKAISIDSKNIYAYDSKAAAYYSLEQYDNVIKNCDIVTNLDSKYADAYYLKASCYAIQNNTSKAIENIKKAVELDEDYLEVIIDDEDFDGIRNTDAFKNLIKDLEKKSMKKYMNN